MHFFMIHWCCSCENVNSLLSLCTFGSDSVHGKIAQCSALLTDRHNRCISIHASVDLVFSAAHQVHNTTEYIYYMGVCTKAFTIFVHTKHYTHSMQSNELKFPSQLWYTCDLYVHRSAQVKASYAI